MSLCSRRKFTASCAQGLRSHCNKKNFNSYCMVQVQDYIRDLKTCAGNLSTKHTT